MSKIYDKENACVKHNGHSKHGWVTLVLRNINNFIYHSNCLTYKSVHSFNFQVTFDILFLVATIKRFYRRTNILESGDKFEITLDQRKLKTPKGRVMEASSKPLALAIALEWDSQKETINRSNMHLVTLDNGFIFPDQ